ncbi:DUF6934 family protein [Mucilaginibacter psychrotolerans]|uniref:Uncharacterized protein n=1 Tax=Mucilaginibacter psychrotolerans TaxID=1524096 RepID=A0A4Y8SC73_9SPHI|nr:hypothetical protein [Mucilaginibacter psychrotolerans]TFF35946.1 hypothetical protein E2R66_17155 [Mucilaginibacter psychrotolerans]
MNLERYPYYATDDAQEYTFYSEGPRGLIRKVVKFVKARDNPIIYNLGFGDVDALTGIIDDLAITDNKDRDRILATVATTINEFCDHHGNHYIYAEGNTPAKTRLYQMSIGRMLNDIKPGFEVYGFRDDGFESFQLNVNYEAFLVKRKEK